MSDSNLFTSTTLSTTPGPSDSPHSGISETSNPTTTVPESTLSSSTERSGLLIIILSPVTSTASTESTTSSNSSTEITSTAIAPPEQTEGPSSTSNSLSNTENPKQTEAIRDTSPPLPSGAIASIVIGVFVLITLAVAGVYLVNRRKRKYASRKDEGSGPPRLFSRSVVGSKGGHHYQDEENTKTDIAPPVQFDAPLDDFGLVKLFDHLDNRISDHLVNFNLDENIGSPEFAEQLDSGGPKAAGEGIIYRGKSLLKREDSRLYTLRALFAYHVFGAIANQMIFTEEQREWVHQAARDDRPARRAALCRQLESEDNFAQIVDFLYRHLESKTQIHVPRNLLASENRLASLREIAKGAALVSLRLGLQRDNFKLVFLFQSRHYAQARGKIPCETSAIKDFDVNPEDFEILGETGSGRVVRAMISPSVYRCPNGAQKYMVRRMKVFTTPSKSSSLGPSKSSK